MQFVGVEGGRLGRGLGAQCAGTELLTSTIFFSVNLQMSPNKTLQQPFPFNVFNFFFRQVNNESNNDTVRKFASKSLKSDSAICFLLGELTKNPTNL